ncbi:MAG TPA: hypothetical protein VE078_01690 [Thermoanaerobaculia bacterium]|nr:hypothetical protein [Thermoanaerobaculia bacterium]
MAAIEPRPGEKPAAIEEDDDRLQSGKDQQQGSREAGYLKGNALPVVDVQGPRRK